MNLSEYLSLAKRTRNFTHSTLRKDKAELINWCFGLAGEVGEFINLVKKNIFHCHAVTREMYIDELGDILYYFIAILDTLDLDLEEIMKYNIDKLNERFPNGFSSEASINRKENK